VLVIGAGFGGLALAHRLADHDVTILERDDGVGGTWRANRYPGAACDVPSHLYSLSFAPNPHWSRTYASQPEILRYVEDCYDRLGVRDAVRTDTTVVSATWSADAASWRLVDQRGDVHVGDVVVSAVGMFSTPRWPDIEGLDTFAGTVVHSARWDPDLDLRDRRVAVIGTGASAIQIVPAIVDRVAHLDLYQRSAPWVLPRPDGPYTDEDRRRFAEDPAAAAAHRRELHDGFERTTAFLTGDPVADTIAGFAGDYLERKVTDPELRERLRPRSPFGCTRTLVSSDYYPAVQRPDVDLVTDRIERVTRTGVRTVDGSERPVDTIVMCTGFHAAEYLRGITVTGRDGRDLHDTWAGTPSAYHGICVPGFPNFFMMYGPNTNQGGNSILLVLEAQARFVAVALDELDRRDGTSIEVTEAAMGRYRDELRRDLAGTVWVDGCRTYFHGAGGDVLTQLPHTTGWYRARTERIDPGDFSFGGAT
jgi:cation diffusion facilitator CzcD-associated flavoprotein CzcO